MENKENNFTPIELDDDQLENISGGFAVGDVVKISSWQVQYCPRCGTLIANLPATITGIRGTVDNKTNYWVTYSCCGYKSSSIETAMTR